MLFDNLTGKKTWNYQIWYSWSFLSLNLKVSNVVVRHSQYLMTCLFGLEFGINLFFFHFSCQEARENCHFSQTVSVFSTFQGSALAKRYFKVSHANCWFLSSPIFNITWGSKMDHNIKYPATSKDEPICARSERDKQFQRKFQMFSSL